MRGLQSDAATPDDSRLITPGDYATINSYQLPYGTRFFPRQFLYNPI